MKRDITVILLCFVAGLGGANVQPILTGSGKLVFPEASPSATLSASSGAPTLSAGGTNQNVNLLPSGTGYITVPTTPLSSTILFVLPNLGAIGTNDSAGTTRAILYLGNENPDVLHVRNGQHGSGGPIQFEAAGAAIKATINTSTGLSRFGDATVPSYAVDSAGDVNAVGVFRKGGTAGISFTLTYLKSAGVTCTVTVSGGIATATGGVGCP